MHFDEKGEIQLAEIPSNLNDDKEERFKEKQKELKIKLLEFLDELENYKNNFLVEKSQNPEKDCSYNGDLLTKHENIRTIHQDINNLIKKDNEEKKNAKLDETKAKLIKNDVYEFINTQEHLTNINTIKNDIESIINHYNSTIGNRILKYNDIEINNYLDNITIYSHEIQSISKKQNDRFEKIKTIASKKRNEIIKKFNEENSNFNQISENLKLIIGNRGFCIEEYKNPDNQLQCYKIKRHSTDNADKKERLKKFSEGEKTAICFAFYLTRIQESKEKDIIAVIDDPICSLDQNIIYNVHSQIIFQMLNNNNVCQWFVMTHNYHFAYLINEFFTKNEITRHSHQTKYLSKGSFQLIDISFKDEYRLLCEYIKEIKDKTIEGMQEYDVLFIGNALRRVSEKFTKFKIKEDRINHSKMKEIIKNSSNDDSKKEEY